VVGSENIWPSLVIKIEFNMEGCINVVFCHHTAYYHIFITKIIESPLTVNVQDVFLEL
jgi:hypothetical protein